ncbi:MAG: Mrp/NBP35 family ATP-binding protein [Chitinophagales bacterium]|nr:Mrp/NBP35 family ATP-binding protein [Chitinophagales bacterium]HMY23808.1 Mrp/NBP35 family ATP-binding protein [Chitinophagales bacterium]HNB49057.1 Mrp/NBP35 family ATP-binding protein [Chitinophagales bacterium]HND82512.1 Mrp/NBP35 family ATP-binding protein [Chitinophagales bacterium]HNF19622.1 Mrp/NBP35 family ATP-binding protein [Chitinophagales bacterium]
MKFTEQQIIHALSQVEDPDFKKDLVSLKMIKDLSFTDDLIKFTIELTTPACPLKEQMENDCRNAIAQLVSNDVKVEIDFSSRVTTLRDVKSDILPSVKNIITVASGKGGVGKSTVSVNLALALLRTGAKVGLIDADIYGPSIPTMLGLQNARPSIQKVDDKNKIVPVDYLGMQVMSIGFLIQDKQPVAWRGPMATSALRQIITDVLWEELDYLILDLPPGTGDIHLTLAQLVPVTGAVVVTTPQEVAMADARKAIAFYQLESIHVPVLGVVENMSFFTPLELPDKKYYIFGKGGGRLLAQQFEVPFLGELPIEQDIREGGDLGKPIALQTATIAAAAFEQLAQTVARQIAVQNANAEVMS